MPDDARSSPQPDPEPEPQRGPQESPEPIDLLQPLFREQPLRPEGAEAPPMWLWMLIFGTLLFGAFYLGAYVGDFSPYPWLQSPQSLAQAEAAPAEPTPVSGASVYSSRCANCHQGNGEGVANAFPPLNRARWVENEGQIIRILLHGMQGPVEVRGATYNGNMPAWGTILSDAEIAAVITHVRQQWDNDFSTVTADQVAGVRASTEGRTAPWTAEELDQSENQTVPDAAASESQATASSATPPRPTGPELYARLVFTP